MEKLEGTASSPLEVELPSLLFHTGCLTIKEVVGNNIKLGYPNEEVRFAMANLCAEKWWLRTQEN